jgi:putative ABC transport system substrate-binding protein
MRLIGLVLALSLTLAAIPIEAQRTHRIGVLSTEDGPEWDAFREILRGLGYVDGRNIALEYRWHRGEIDRLPGLARISSART